MELGQQLSDFLTSALHGARRAVLGGRTPPSARSTATGSYEYEQLLDDRYII